jgi:LacI family transcriptional regulator
MDTTTTSFPSPKGKGAGRQPHVALLIETSRTYGRDLLRGIKRFMSEHEPWSIFTEMRALESPVPPWLVRWRGDGILTRTNSQAMADAIRKTGVPAVELRATKLRHNLPFIGVDNRWLGQMVAEHLLECGFRHFGVYELATEGYFEERRDNFIETLRRAGFPCHEYQTPDRREKPVHWEKQQAAVARWIAGLPKPIGIMACTDQLGFWLLDACRRAGVAVPEEVAVVGVENDESLCAMSTPPLSSVQFNGEQIGYQAAAMLARLMAGEPVPKEPMLVKPLGIVTRQSSDVVALENQDLAAAVRFIREHACDGITVDDVLRAVLVSRSSLERQMRNVLGRTPAAEIARVQFNRVRELLSETELSLAAIAGKVGFNYPQYMAEAFKRRFGQTPGEFRAATRGPQKR